MLDRKPPTLRQCNNSPSRCNSMTKQRITPTIRKSTTHHLIVINRHKITKIITDGDQHIIGIGRDDVVEIGGGDDDGLSHGDGCEVFVVEERRGVGVGVCEVEEG